MGVLRKKDRMEETLKYCLRKWLFASSLRRLGAVLLTLTLALGLLSGCGIGGDRFGNYEGTLPEGDYHECDIDTLGADRRGTKRLVYSDDGRIYYTENHYESFTLLYGEED